MQFYKNYENRILWIDDEITTMTLEYAKMIMQWNFEDKQKNIPKESRNPIKVIFFSPGGDLEVNNCLVDTIQLSETPVVGINVGMAASSGCFIYLACHKRYTFPTAEFLIHKGAGQFAGNYDEVVAARKAEYDRAYKKLMNAASLLSSQRKKTALNFSQDIINALKQLNFLDVRFEAEFEEKNPDSTGTDNVRFMISTNPGEDMKPLAKIASGGELSRIMLAIKSVMAETDVSKTLIFDEIDAGISGKTAQLVAEKLNTLSKTHQIICITHLPQIAAMADNHYVIEKSTKDNRTISNITKLSYDESIGELARMLGGSSITDAVVSNAKELKNMAQTAKNN